MMGGSSMVGRFAAAQHLPRHRHAHAYAALVLSGGYVECGSRGWLDVGPGQAVLHGRYEAHLNRFRRQGARVFDLPLDGPLPPLTLAEIGDPDLILRTAERDPVEARHLFLAALRPAICRPGDWPALLAGDLLAKPGRSLTAWARQQGLAPETVSRGFAKMFAVSPQRFRLEARSQRALDAILHSTTPFAVIAAATGFADQAHMNRAVRALCGETPSALRRSTAFKTAPALPPIPAA